MKLTTCLTILTLTFACTNITAQISFKTEYFGKSNYRDEDNNPIAGSKGSAIVYQGRANIPLSKKTDSNNRPTLWGIGLSGTYASLDNENLAEDLVLSEIMNLQLGLFHLRPLNEKWSIMASIGAGIYTPDTRFSKIRYKNVLGNLGVVFIRHLKPNLEIGGGLAINNTFGYPMAFPAIYFNWHLAGKFTLKVAAMDGLEISGGYNMNDKLALNIVAEMNGQVALLEKDGKDMMFSHQYIVVGFRPEVKINSHFSIPVTAGFHALRSACYNKRSLKAVFNDGREYDPYFQISPYLSAGIKYNF